MAKSIPVPQWYETLRTRLAEARSAPAGHDAWGHWPARAGHGRAYPRTPVERGTWAPQTTYNAGDIVSYDVGGSVGVQRFLCVHGHVSAPDTSVSEPAFWEIYDPEEDD